MAAALHIDLHRHHHDQYHHHHHHHHHQHHYGEPGLDDAADVVAAALHINLHRHHHHHHYHYGLPCFDDAADVVAAALHIDLQLLRVTVFRKQGHRGGGNLTVPLKEWSVALYPVLKII